MSSGYIQVIGMIIIGLALANASDLIWELCHPNRAQEDRPSKRYTYTMRTIGFVVLFAAVAWGAWMLFAQW